MRVMGLPDPPPLVSAADRTLAILRVKTAQPKRTEPPTTSAVVAEMDTGTTPPTRPALLTPAQRERPANRAGRADRSKAGRGTDIAKLATPDITPIRAAPVSCGPAHKAVTVSVAGLVWLRN